MGIAENLAKNGCRVVINGFGDSQKALERVAEGFFCITFFLDGVFFSDD